MGLVEWCKRTSNFGLLDTGMALMILTHSPAVVIRQGATRSGAASSGDGCHRRRRSAGRDRRHHRRRRLDWGRIAGLRGQHAGPWGHGDQGVEWLELLVGRVWRRAWYCVGWFNWHDWRCLEVVGGIFVHGRGVVLGAAAAVSSHVSPLPMAIIGLMRLMRVCVHAVQGADCFVL